MSDAEVPAVLIDECLPKSFRDYFLGLGWRVFAVGELLPAGSPDASVVAAALNVGAVVVTTDADFRQLKAAATGNKGRLEAADRIFFKSCTHPVARERIAELIDVVEAEYRLARSRGQKFSMHITPNSFTIHR